MPLYDAKCTKCGKSHEYFKAIALSHETPICCGERTEKQLSAPSLSMDIANWDGYISPVSGKFISSKAQRRADMKATGSRDWEGIESERKQVARNKEYEEKAFDAKLDKTVRTAYAQLPQEKKSQLNKEMGG